MSGGTAQFDAYTNSIGSGAPNFPFGLNATTGQSIQFDQITPITTNAGVGIQGVKSGSVVAAGNIGQTMTSIITSTFTQSSATINTYYDTAATLALTTGLWRIDAYAFIICSFTASSTNLALAQLAIRDSSNTVYRIGGSGGSFDASTTAVANTFGSVCLTIFVNISATTTFKTSLQYQSLSGTPASVTIQAATTVSSGYADSYYLIAQRIG